jgi:hypothetical protein
MIRLLVLICFFSFLYLNIKILENYDNDGYDNTRFLHCSESNKLSHYIEDSNLKIEGYGFNNNYLIDQNDIEYKGGDGDFSKFLDVYDLRKEPETLQAPICMQKTNFTNNLHIPSFFKEIYQAGDSNEILNVENSFKNLLYDPFFKYRNAGELKNKIILKNETNDMILRQHKSKKRSSVHNNHIELEDFHKTCSKHDPLGIPFQCGPYREFNQENANKQCEDNSLKENSCNKICCKSLQESAYIS